MNDRQDMSSPTAPARRRGGHGMLPVGCNIDKEGEESGGVSCSVIFDDQSARRRLARSSVHLDLSLLPELAIIIFTAPKVFVRDNFRRDIGAKVPLDLRA